MITLKDYIGKIYKEVTNAKVQSDIETLAIAQEYVQNPMLKHFSVPNIRIKNMELTIPVAVDKTQSVVRDYTQAEVQQIYVDAFESTYLGFLPAKQDYFESIKLDLSNKAELVAVDITPQLQQARIEDEQLAQAPTTSEPTPEGEIATREESTSYATTSGVKYTEITRNAAIAFMDVALGYIGDEIPKAEFESVLTEKISAGLVLQTPKVEELPVIVETQRLKEINDPASMITIKVNIMDDSMEWTTDIDADGNPIQVLNYE